MGRPGWVARQSVDCKYTVCCILLMIINDVREAENKPAWRFMDQSAVSMLEVRMRGETHEYKDAPHIALQRLNPGFVRAHGFLSLTKGPPSISTTIMYWVLKVFENMSQKHTSRPVGATDFLLEVGVLLTWIPVYDKVENQWLYPGEHLTGLTTGCLKTFSFFFCERLPLLRVLPGSTTRPAGARPSYPLKPPDCVVSHSGGRSFLFPGVY
jgi:hypothetical protein